MSLDSVNNGSNNTALYAAGAAAGAGALAGGATGYFTKSIIKDDELTDEFVKKAANNMQSLLPEGSVDQLKALNEATKKCKTAAEYRDVVSEMYKTAMSSLTLDDAKGIMVNNSQLFELMGGKGIAESELKNAGSVDELIQLFKKSFDENFAGKSVKEVQAAYDKAAIKISKNAVTIIFSQIYDFDKKKFLNFDKIFDDSEFGKQARKTAQAIKDAADSIKWKAAGIYGAAAAAVLGLGTLIGVNMMAKNNEQVDTADAQEVPQEAAKAEEA